MHCNFSFFWKKRTGCTAISAFLGKNAPVAATTVRVGEKMRRRRRRQAFLTKKRAVVADDRASRRKNALSSEGFPPQSVSFLGTFDYFCTEKRKYKSNIL